MRSVRPLLCWCVALCGGCASYSEITDSARTAYYAGDYERSAELWTELLDGGGRDKDVPLLLLERGMAHLAAGRYAEAARDFQAGDQQLEVMDFSGNPEEVGKYLFSEDSGLYRGPPHEKILAPTVTALAFAALGDLERTRTAANAAYSQMNRFSALAPSAEFASPLAYVLLGLTAAANGDTQRAHIALSAAYQIRALPSLEPVLLRLLAENARRFGGHWIGKYEARRRQWGEPHPRRADEGELVVVVLEGRAPIRVGSSFELDANQQRFLVESSLANLSVSQPGVNLDEARMMLSRESRLPMAVLAPRPSAFQGGTVQLPDGATLPLEVVLPVERQVVAWFEANRNALFTAAISRMAFRLAVRIGTYLAVKQQSDDSLAALFASMAAGAVLEAADTPDTRAWTLLPRQITFQRRIVPVGQHAVDVVMHGSGGQTTLTRTVEVAAGGLAFVVVVAPG